jgi:hypothetical protein
MSAKGVSFAGENQKCGLRGIFRGVVVAKNTTTDVLNQGRMPPNEQFKGCFIVGFNEPGKQFLIGRTGWVIPRTAAQVFADY